MPNQVNGLLSPWLQRRRIEAALPHLRGVVLDYGCGTGRLAAACPPDRYVGVDTDAESLALARRSFPEHRFLTEPEGDTSYDTIVALAVLEHAADAGTLLGRFRRLLKPGGRVVVTTPLPALEWVYTVGVRLHLFSREAAAEHRELIDCSRMAELASQARLQIVLYRRFLFGANQLFVLAPEGQVFNHPAGRSA